MHLTLKHAQEPAYLSLKTKLVEPPPFGASRCSLLASVLKLQCPCGDYSHFTRGTCQKEAETLNIQTLFPKLVVICLQVEVS